ncbi:MAG TPA: alpha/beta hydrolase [Pyrinomonadaceae bacterium]|jgi:pimeloyl-ACP methyl ester carboxylesterase|nr:alpha/beta hydrolase [Pyrinomonadaceae bacterium]
MKKRYLFAGLTGVVGGAVAAKLLTRPRDVNWRDSLDFIYNPEYSWFTRVNGVRVHYQEAGDEQAPPIILIHGFISSNLIWSHVLLPLARKGFRVIAPDLPGYGYSEKPGDARYTIAEQARFVVGFMDRLRIKKAIVAGASYGGAVAATVALDYADRVDKLILIGAVTNDDAKKKFLLRVSCLPVIGDIATPLFLGSRWILRKRMQDMYRRMQKPINEKMVASRHHLLATANTHRAMIRTARAWSANRIEREASLIRQPAMLMWGDHDDHIPLSNAVRLRDLIPHTRLIVFRNCGHLPPAEYPEKFVEAVAEFCGTKLPGDEDPR